MSCCCSLAACCRPHRGHRAHRSGRAVGHVANQSRIYSLAPEARSRINTSIWSRSFSAEPWARTSDPRISRRAAGRLLRHSLAGLLFALVYCALREQSMRLLHPGIECAYSPDHRRVAGVATTRRGRLIQFPQLTMPLIAALTPPSTRSRIPTRSSSRCGSTCRPTSWDHGPDAVRLHAYALARNSAAAACPS
jgi:hypothetical protein